jgi:plastocyanin
MTRARATALLATLAFAAAGCGGSESGGSDDEGKTVTLAGVAASDHGTKQVSGEAEVELDDDYFEPTVLQGKPGEKVELELKNEGSAEHNFTLDEQNVDQDVEAGETATVTVTIPSSGQLSFYCKYHKDRGMAGALEAS